MSKEYELWDTVKSNGKDLMLIHWYGDTKLK
jgi:hypothetical protein